GLAPGRDRLLRERDAGSRRSLVLRGRHHQAGDERPLRADSLPVGCPRRGEDPHPEYAGHGRHARPVADARTQVKRHWRQTAAGVQLLGTLALAAPFAAVWPLVYVIRWLAVGRRTEAFRPAGLNPWRYLE